MVEGENIVKYILHQYYDWPHSVETIVEDNLVKCYISVLDLRNVNDLVEIFNLFLKEPLNIADNIVGFAYGDLMVHVIAETYDMRDERKMVK